MPKTNATRMLLRNVGLRPTWQRVALAGFLFNGVHKHFSADSLFDDLQKARMKVSRATVYNTLHQFKDAGLLREIALEGDRNYYDTDTSNHFHFFHEEDGALIDIDQSALEISGLPKPPAGKVIDRVDVIVRLKKAE